MLQDVDFRHSFDLVIHDDGLNGAQALDRSDFFVAQAEKAIDTFGTFGTAGTFGGCFGCMGTAGCCC